MRRGNLVTVAVSGDGGKPTPAIVIQSDHLVDTDSVLVCLLTSTLRAAPLYRLPLPTDAATSLRKPSDVMVDKILAVPRDRCGAVIGRADDAALLALKRLLAFVIGVAD